MSEALKIFNFYVSDITSSPQSKFGLITGHSADLRQHFARGEREIHILIVKMSTLSMRVTILELPLEPAIFSLEI